VADRPKWGEPVKDVKAERAKWGGQGGGALSNLSLEETASKMDGMCLYNDVHVYCINKKLVLM